MLRLLLFAVGIIVLIAGELFRVYYIMPFPGSQVENTIDTAYFFHQNIWWIRIVGLALVAWPTYRYLSTGRIWIQWPPVLAIGVWLIVWYMVSSVMTADRMFIQPKHKVMASVTDNKIPLRDLVVGVEIAGESRAYPIEVIGYHHQVRDTIGGQPVMVTYCTVCRTGRVFSPMVDGQPETFRLVGMDHYNAMFEDATTKSWWRQVNGEAITGPKKGTFLPEIPSNQMRLSAWIESHPDTKVMQRDPDFLAPYDSAALYDEGRMTNRLERTDSVPWLDKSWVIGVEIDGHARAYDWLTTRAAHVVNDTLGGSSIVVAIEGDSASFHVWRKPDSVFFIFDPTTNRMRDRSTNSVWNWKGECVEGKLKGATLPWQQSYQEYWHSWRTFHPRTTRFEIPSQAANLLVPTDFNKVGLLAHQPYIRKTVIPANVN